MSVLLAFDRASARSVDENGFLHVSSSHITKATVNPYRGREIPGWKEAGLDPETIYYGFRDPVELQKSLPTWEGLPLHIEHHPDSAADPAKLTRVGAVGKAVWNAPYIDAPLTVWDGTAIDAIESGAFRELSCAYRYDPDFTPGQHDGIEYDFVMRNIRGNHVALVEEGRAGADVVVADGALDAKKDEGWATTKNGRHVHFKDGEIDKGNVGQKPKGEPYKSRPIDSTAPDADRYAALLREHHGNHQEAAHGYFREKLQGRHVEAQTDAGPIQATFTGRTWQEIKRNMNQDTLKAELVPHMPDIIATGTYRRNELFKDRDDSATAFHEYRKQVETSAGTKEAIVDVAERPQRQPAHLVYNLTREGTQNYEDRKRKAPSGTSGSSLKADNGALRDSDTVKESSSSPVAPGQIRGTRKTPTQDSNAADGETIAPQFEVVNLRFNDSGMARDQKTHTLKGVLMGKLKSLFRGALDADPDIERKEVDLAQAIIDLHKVDPATGEIVDITEDEDKAAEIRKLVGEFAGKLEPEEIKKLTDALSDLAYSRATGDAEPGDGKPDSGKPGDGLREAMDKCGLDAENPAESKAFAEGVKYGEGLMRDPAEREKLDREHEREGAEKKLAGDEDKNAEIQRILDSVPDLSAEQRAKLESSLSGLAYSGATSDAEPDNELKGAQDSALRMHGRRGSAPLTAMDAARIKASAVAEAKEHIRGLEQAVRHVLPLTGNLDSLSFDSASEVYAYALRQSGIDPTRYPRQAWQGMVDMLRLGKAQASPFAGDGFGSMAQDSLTRHAEFSGKFAGLKNITLAE
ncbi:MAG: DUF2213 domain-containing protein [Desulfovibrionaceae bacterium]|nr:DUF2213 domain-containing protein [Desulfovibrionaceae bacterium]